VGSPGFIAAGSHAGGAAGPVVEPVDGAGETAERSAITRLDPTGILTATSLPAGQLPAAALGTSTASRRADGNTD
jgi:hypothetical protein